MSSMARPLLRSGFDKSIAIKFVVAARLIPENQDLNWLPLFFFQVHFQVSDIKWRSEMFPPRTHGSQIFGNLRG